MNLRKLWKVTSATALLSIVFSATAFAGQWASDNTGWWYDNGDGTYPSNTWQWIDGNGDGISECYYFDSTGYCLANGLTPDGYEVDTNGAWVINGIIQTQKGQDTSAETAVSISDDIAWQLVLVAHYVYDSFDTYPYAQTAFPINAHLSDLSLSQKCQLLYSYQYNCIDPRFEDTSDYEYKMIKNEDLNEVIIELLGPASQVTIQTIRDENYIVRSGLGSNMTYYSYFNATGDFGDAGSFYLSSDNVSFTMENGRLKVSGNVMQYNSNASSYSPIRQYHAYFIPHNGFCLGGYRFDQLIVE